MAYDPSADVETVRIVVVENARPNGFCAWCRAAASEVHDPGCELVEALAALDRLAEAAERGHSIDARLLAVYEKGGLADVFASCASLIERSTEEVEAAEARADTADNLYRLLQHSFKQANIDRSRAIQEAERAEGRVTYLESRLRDAPVGGDGSHWVDCWRSHIDCAAARVEKAEARVGVELDLRKAAYVRIAELERERDEYRQEYLQQRGLRERAEIHLPRLTAMEAANAELREALSDVVIAISDPSCDAWTVARVREMPNYRAALSAADPVPRFVGGAGYPLGTPADPEEGQ